ncbi:MAG: flagellar basal body P-ring formation chaperone FlgA [Steroidobacteraceae bacterium]
MKRTTEYRRAGLLIPVAMMLLGLRPLRAQEAVQDPAVESLDTIRSTAEAYVKSLIPPSAGESTVTVGQLDGRLRLARCASKNLSASLPAGMALQARATVGVTCAGSTHWTVYVPVTVESKINVLVLTRAVNRDARLTAADVTLETRRTAGPGNAYLSTPAELSGRTVRRPLAAGTTLSIDMFTPDLIVRRGQEVTLLSSGGAVEVRASGRAMVDGVAGARIQVQNLSSMRVVEGVVESADLVRVAR